MWNVLCKRQPATFNINVNADILSAQSTLGKYSYKLISMYILGLKTHKYVYLRANAIMWTTRCKSG